MDINIANILSASASAAPMCAAFAAWIYSKTSSKYKECELARASLEDRVTAIEAIQGGDFPRWVRSDNRVILSVSPQFVALFGTPVGYRAEDFIGRRFDELPKINKELVSALNKLDEQLSSGVNFASASGVRFSETRTATIIKTVIATPHGTMYVGCACPEYPN